MDFKFKKIYIINTLLFIIIIFSIFIFGVSLASNISFSIASDEEDAIPPNISDVQVFEVTGTTSIITWETNELADSLVNFGLDKNYGIARDPHSDKLSHMIILENLLPGSKYYFRITSSDDTGNQGISSDYTFTTEEALDIKRMRGEIGEGQEEGDQEEGEKEKEMKEGNLGKGESEQEIVQEIIQMVEMISSEEALETVDEIIKTKAEEIISPPTIILDYADVEVGTDYAIIRWETDKEANSMVALARDENYDGELLDPYVWNEGDPDELVLEHVVEINGLIPSTVYHFQVSSKSSLGLEGKSEDKTFKTKSILPEIYNIQIAKIQEDSATIRWTTNIPCSAIIEYTNLNNSDTKLEGNSSYFTVHSMQLSNLIFDTYYSAIIKVESEDGEKAESDPLTFITTKDEYPPIISKVNTESTLYPGSENKIQTVASWRTDEMAQCQLFYHQGLFSVEEPDSLAIEEDYGIKHVQVITNFLPSSVYKFWIVCSDEAGNEEKSDDFTMLTPTQEESIIDIILKNFESSFGWVKKLKM